MKCLFPCVVEGSVCPVRGSVIVEEVINHFGGWEWILEGIHVPRDSQVLHSLAEPLPACRFIAPQKRRWNMSRWGNMLSDYFKHLPDVSARGPIAHSDFSARPAHPDHFRCHELGAGREHGADQAHHNIEGAVRKRQVLGITLTNIYVQPFGGRPAP